jgi:glyoxalase-like protein
VSARLRQAVIAARDLDTVAGTLRTRLGLGEPFSDPAVGHFGLRNAVFALGDTFLEVVSPARLDTAAGRLIQRRGGDCGYMLMFQLEDVAGARRRAAQLGVREVFAVELDDMAEAHLHPSDMQAAIVSISQPDPATAWRWGGPDWATRSAPPALRGATVAVVDPDAVAARWDAVLGGLPPGLRIVGDAAATGLTEIALTAPVRSPCAIELERVRVVVSPGDRLEVP